MSLVEEYYELNESKDVSAVWKVLQIGFYISAACLGLASGFTLGILREKFDKRCYLFAEVKIPSKEHKIENINVSWGSDTRCDYYQFSMVSSFIVGIIWATLFLMCGKGGKSLTGLPQPWRIVWPSLLFNFIYLVIALTTAICIHQGTTHFCALYNFNKRIHKKSLLEKCEPLKLLIKKNEIDTISAQLGVVLITAWGCVISWFILFLLSLFRIIFVVDFHLYKICVFKIDDTVQNKTEEVLRITYYEEPRKLYYNKDEDRGSLSELDETVEDLEAGTRKKVKLEKFANRNYNAVNRTAIQENAAFYVTGDIRMLRKEKKREKTPKALNEAFGRNDLRVKLKKVTNMRSNLDISAKSDVSKFLYPYNENLYTAEDDEAEISSIPKTQTSDLNTDWSDSGSENESFDERYKSCRSIKSKKHI